MRSSSVPCPKCRYDLRAQIGSRGAVCPECGGEWSRSDLLQRQFELREVRFGWYCLSTIQILFTPLVFAVGAVFYEATGAAMSLLTLALIWIVACAWFNLILARHAAPRGAWSRDPGFVMYVALVFFLINLAPPALAAASLLIALLLL